MPTEQTRPRCGWRTVGLAALSFALLGSSVHADTVASLLGNFTVNQYAGLTVQAAEVDLHYVVIFGQLPALRELHLADADGNGITTQAERDAYVKGLAAQLGAGLHIDVDGSPLSPTLRSETTSLPTEQGGFSLRMDIDYAATLPSVAQRGAHQLHFANDNYAGRLGWREIVVQPRGGMSVFDGDAYSTSLTGGLTEALGTLPAAGPLDERGVALHFSAGAVPPGARPLLARPGTTALGTSTPATPTDSIESAWIARETRELVTAISAPHLAPRIALFVLLGALLLGAVHALSPGHGKTIVGAYLIGSRGTPRHAVFLGLTVTITHTLGVFVLGFATLYASRFIVPERLFPILSLISALLVLGMGLVLLIQRTRAARAQWSPAVSPQFMPVKAIAVGARASRSFALAPAGPGHTLDTTLHSHGGGPLHSHLPPGASGETVTWRSLLTLGISGGLVPCPSAMVLLLAAVALNKTAYGMILVIAFSAGLAMTLTVVGLVFLYARNRFYKPASPSRWATYLPIASAASITGLGVLLCAGALRIMIG